MARPSTHDDIATHRRTRDLATFHLDQFSGSAPMMRAYSLFLSTAQAIGAAPPLASGGHITIARPLTDDELDTALAQDQRDWDSHDKRYYAVRDALQAGELASLTPAWQDYEAYYMRQHAEAEGYPVLALFSKDEEARKAAREDAMEVNA